MKKLMMTMMAAVRAVQQPVLTTVAEQPQTTTINMVAVLVRQLPDRIMVAEPLQPTTTNMAVTSDQAPTDKKMGALYPGITLVLACF